MLSYGNLAEFRVAARRLVGGALGVWLAVGPIATAGCDGRDTPPAVGRQTAESDVADPSDFGFSTLDGRRMELGDFRGSVLLVDFWAVWCGPCLETLPHLRSLHERYADRGLSVVSVSLDLNLDAAREMIDRQAMTWPQVMDRQQEPRLREVFADSLAGGLPHCVLYDREGTLIWRGDPREVDGPLREALGSSAEGEAQ